MRCPAYGVRRTANDRADRTAGNIFTRYAVRCALCALAVVGGLSSADCVGEAQPGAETIRVAVVRDHPEVTLRVAGRFRLMGPNPGAPLQEGRHLLPMVVRAVPDGLALGGDVLPQTRVRIEPTHEASIILNGTRLRGALEITRQENLTLLVVNAVSLEEYLRGVLSKEAPDWWPQEALKAIAIAARTYAWYWRMAKANDPYDVAGDVMSQEYGGRSAEKRATTRAVQATEGMLLTFQGAVFPAFYHSTCGGMTEHARVMGAYDVEPLRGGVRCRWCSASPFFSWRQRLTKADWAWALSKSAFGPVGAVLDVRVTKRTPAGRVAQLVVTGAQRTVTLSGFDVRSVFGFERIRSPWFAVEPDGDAFILTGRGWGHGVGMCQWGAAGLARLGMNAEEILAVYYPGAELAHAS